MFVFNNNKLIKRGFFMQINTHYNSPYFGVKLNTTSVLEATTMKIIYNNSIEGFKEVAHALNETPIKATGSKGYKYYADKFGKMILEKYPQIAQATKDIQEIIEKNPNMRKKDLAKLVQPVVDRFDKQIDITL